MKFIDHIVDAPLVRLLSPGDRFITIFQKIAVEGNTHGNLVFDAQIAALCIEHGATQLLTCDRDFARFPDLTIISLS